jgi:hypothetical protein
MGTREAQRPTCSHDRWEADGLLAVPLTGELSSGREPILRSIIQRYGIVLLVELQGTFRGRLYWAAWRVSFGILHLGRILPEFQESKRVKPEDVLLH